MALAFTCMKKVYVKFLPILSGFLSVIHMQGKYIRQNSEVSSTVGQSDGSNANRLLARNSGANSRQRDRRRKRSGHERRQLDRGCADARPALLRVSCALQGPAPAGPSHVSTRLEIQGKTMCPHLFL